MTHPGSRLNDLIDGRLDDRERRAVELHLEDCASCRREVARLDRARRLVRLETDDTTMPPDLMARVSAALDHEDAREARPAPPRRLWRPVLVAAVLVLVVAVGVQLWRGPGPAPPSAAPADAAQAFRDYQRGVIALAVRTDAIPDIEAYFRASALDFEARVFDLAMMQWSLAGGRVHEISGAASAMFVYEDPTGRILMCEMYRASSDTLPVGATIQHNNDIEFYIYERAGTTLVFWQEGEVLCVLAGDFDRDEVVQLAYAKAVKV